MRLETITRLDDLIQKNLHAAPGTRARALRDRGMRTQNNVLSYRQTAPKLPGKVGRLQ